MNNDQKNKIFNMFEKNKFGVVATLSAEHDRPPESAVVAISHTPKLEIVFGSFKTTRKNINLTHNSNISVVIGWDNSNKKTLQIEGRAQQVLDRLEREKVEIVHCAKNPESEKFKNDPRQEYFKIIPDWIRYSDFSQDPQEVWEIKL